MKPLAHLARAVPLAITLAAGAVAWLFTAQPERVRAFDERWTARHAAEPVERATALAADAAAAPGEALPALERFIAGLGDAKRGDRVFVALRAARRARAEALVASGQTKKGLDAAEAFAAEDAHDLDTRLWAGTLVSRYGRDPGSDPDRGAAILTAAFDELPELGVTARALHDAQRRAGDGAAALDTLLLHLAVSPRALLSMEGLEQSWLLWWTAGDAPFEAERRTSALAAVTPAYIAVSFEVPAGAERLRLDPPGGSRLAFDRSIFAVVTDAGPAQVDLAGLELETRSLRFDGSTLETHGEADPWVTFALPESQRGAALEARWVLGTPRLPVWLDEALAEPTEADFAAALERLEAASTSEGSIVLDAAAGALRAREARARGLARRAAAVAGEGDR